MSDVTDEADEWRHGEPPPRPRTPSDEDAADQNANEADVIVANEHVSDDNLFVSQAFTESQSANYSTAVGRLPPLATVPENMLLKFHNCGQNGSTQRHDGHDAGNSNSLLLLSANVSAPLPDYERIIQPSFIPSDETSSLDTLQHTTSFDHSNGQMSVVAWDESSIDDEAKSIDSKPATPKLSSMSRCGGIQHLTCVPKSNTTEDFGIANYSQTKAEGSSLCSSFSVSSLSDYSSLTSTNFELASDELSGSSKRSSLDRRSTDAQRREAAMAGEAANGMHRNTSRLVNSLSSILPRGFLNVWRSSNVSTAVPSGNTTNTTLMPRLSACAPFSGGHRRQVSSSSVDSAHSAPEQPNNRQSISAESAITGWRLFPCRTSVATADGGGSQAAAAISDSESNRSGENNTEEEASKAGSISSTWRTIPVNHSDPVLRLNDLSVSTTALILENRPVHLPAKAAEESERHRKQYALMIDAARKKEQKENRKRKKILELQQRNEEALVVAAREWTNDILPHWDQLRTSRRVRDLWAQGLPSSVRGRVWKLAIGNELNITKELFEICSQRAQTRFDECDGATTSPQAPAASQDDADGRTASLASGATTTANTKLELLLDVERTFPYLGIFQQNGPYHHQLLQILGAYSTFRPDVGYVQGMSFVAAVLTLNFDSPFSAFTAFANLLNRDCLVSFYRFQNVDTYLNAYNQYFKEQLPKLFIHFEALDVTPKIYLLEWLFTLYAKSLSLDVACKVWDLFLRDGEEFLFKTALAILNLYHDILIDLDFDQTVKFLLNLPPELTASKLFGSIEQLKKCGAGKDRRRFSQILSQLFQSPT